MSDTRHTEPRADAARARLGACVCAGWAVHDVVLFAGLDRPEDVWRLLPALLVAIACGAVVGALRVELVALALGAAASLPVAKGALGLDASPALANLGPTIVTVALAMLAGRLVLRLRRSGAARAGVPAGGTGGTGAIGLALGVLAALAHARSFGWRAPFPPSVELTLLGAAAATLGASFLPRAGARIGAALVAFAVPFAVVAPVAMQNAARVRPDLPPPTARAEAGATSALLVVLDTVRADRMGIHGATRDTTPRLDAFARDEATLYTNARSASSWTLPSHASLLTGRYPAQHGATHARDRTSIAPGQSDRMPLADDATTLAEELRDAGYHTAGIVANAMIGAWSGIDQGFEDYDDRRTSAVRRYLPFAQIGAERERIGHEPYRNATTITDEALAWIDDERRADAPFFLMLNYLDAHSPYQAPPPYDALFGDGDELDLDELRRIARTSEPLDEDLRRRSFELLYDRELRYLDAEVGRLLDGLRARGLFDDVLIVVTSDHGEAFGEHEAWGHDSTLFEEVVHVPLFVKPAGGRVIERVDEPTTFVDVHGYLRGVLLGRGPERAPAAPAGLLGELFFSPSIRSDPFFDTEPGAKGTREPEDLLAWIDAGVKTIVGSTGNVRAYRLADDPGERAPLELTPDEVEAARERARAWWAAHPPRAASASRDEAMDDATRARLHDLGYVGDDEADDH